MPEMPDSFFDMLEGLLVYRHKKRKSAGEMLSHEFVQFHKTAFSVEQISMQAQADDGDAAGPLPDGLKRPVPMGRTTSISLRGSVGRHSQFLDYQKYQRSLTTLLATLLDKKELTNLITTISEFLAEQDAGGEAKMEEPEKTPGAPELPGPEKRLDILHMKNLKTLLKKQKHEQV